MSFKQSVWQGQNTKTYECFYVRCKSNVKSSIIHLVEIELSIGNCKRK